MSANPSLNSSVNNPTRVQQALIESKITLILLREVLLEVKDVLVVLTMILFFLLGVATAIWKLYG